MSLIERAKQRDETAFLTLITRYIAMLLGIIRRYIHRMIGYEEQDILQEIQLRAYVILPEFRGDEAAFECWLRSSTEGVCLNILKKQRPHIPIDDLSEIVQMALVDGMADLSQEDPLSRLIKKEEFAQIKKALPAIPEQYRKVIILRYWNKLTYNEIADILGIPIGTVKSGLNKGINALKDQLRVG